MSVLSFCIVINFIIVRLLCLLQVCSSIFNIWDEFKDHLVSHTGVKPNHCTVCDMWFTHPKELKEHLKDVHSIEDKSTEDLVATDSAATAAHTIATQHIEEGETVLLDDGIQMEHVTVEPLHVVEMEQTATVVVDEEGVAEMCEEDVERLKQAGVEIQVVQVTTPEIEVEGEMVNVEEVEQAVVV